MIHQMVVRRNEILSCNLRKPTLSFILKALRTVAEAATKCKAKYEPDNYEEDDFHDLCAARLPSMRTLRPVTHPKKHGLLARSPMILLEFRSGFSGKQSGTIPGTDHPRAGRATQRLKE